MSAPDLPDRDKKRQRAEEFAALWHKRDAENKERMRRLKEEDPDFYFHGCVGWIMQKWATIDRDIFDLFRLALGLNNDVKAARLYYRANNIADRFQMTDLLMQLDLNKKQLKLWKDITKEFERLSAVRNRLAHDPVVSIFTLSEDTKSISSYRTQISIEEAKLIRSINKPVPPPISMENLVRYSKDLVTFQYVMLTKFLTTFPKRAQKRFLRPLSIPSRLRPPAKSEKSKKGGRKMQGLPHPSKPSHG